MWIGDIIRNIKREDANNCSSFKDGDKRKVKLYGKVVEKLEFKDKIGAERWLYDYWRDKKNTVLLDDLEKIK